VLWMRLQMAPLKEISIPRVPSEDFEELENKNGCSKDRLFSTYDVDSSDLKWIKSKENKSNLSQSHFESLAAIFMFLDNKHHGNQIPIENKIAFRRSIFIYLKSKPKFATLYSTNSAASGEPQKLEHKTSRLLPTNQCVFKPCQLENYLVKLHSNIVFSGSLIFMLQKLIEREIAKTELLIRKQKNFENMPIINSNTTLNPLESQIEPLNWTVFDDEIYSEFSSLDVLHENADLTKNFENFTMFSQSLSSN